MRKLAITAFAFSAGIFLAQYLLPFAWQLPLCLCCAAAGLAGFAAKGIARRRVFLICGGLSAALAWNYAYTMLVQVPAERLTDAEHPAVTMTVLDYAQPTDYGAKVTVRPEIDGLRGVKGVYYGDEALLELQPGCTITDDVLLSSAATVRDTDITTFTSRGVFLLAYSRGEPVYGAGTSGSVRWLPQTCADAMRRQIQTIFPEDIAQFLCAVLTGDKSGISDADAASLSEAGLYHILAVSGMHCAYLLTLLTVLTGSGRRRLRAALGIPALIFYAVLTGCSPSVVRACVMLLFVLAASLFHRENDMPTSMAAALMLILLENPFAAASVSLQLSFAAISGIIWAAPAIRKLFPDDAVSHRLARFVLYSVTTSLGVAVCTAPLSAYYFDVLYLVSPLSNLLCLWAAGIVFCVGLAAVALSFLWMPLGMCAGTAAAFAAKYILWMAKWLASLPYHAVYFFNPYLKYWLVFAYGLFFLCWLLKPKAVRKYAVAAVLCTASLAGVVWLGSLRYASGELHITMLDVGQGASMAVSSGEDYLLIDCGSHSSWYDAGDIAANALASMNCRELDYLLLTHYDSDHISGVAALLARIPVGCILLPDTEDDSGLRQVVEALAEYHGVAMEFVTEMQQYPLGNACVTVYPPAGESEDNNLGLSCLCSAGEYDLFSGGKLVVEA